ncbi:MAG: hypothetical protein M3527_05810, partial [Actinomycetota bacterium]|nr:hypothetical protein [Actinomycetota bacterium]
MNGKVKVKGATEVALLDSSVCRAATLLDWCAAAGRFGPVPAHQSLRRQLVCSSRTIRSGSCTPVTTPVAKPSSSQE